MLILLKKRNNLLKNKQKLQKEMMMEVDISDVRFSVLFFLIHVEVLL